MRKYIQLALIATTALFVSCKGKQQMSFETVKAEIQDLSTSVTATGTIEPVTKVEVGTQVSGIINKIFVDYNSVVHKGEVIAELDKTNLLAELSNAQSNLSNAESNLNYQEANYKRYKTLYDKGLVSADEYESAQLSYQQARQQMSIEQQNVAKAKTNLGYATITAPIDGVVLSKEVEEGQTVASAMTTPTLFIIAQDLTDMRVIADVDEADIGNVKEGQSVTFTVDAYPDEVFHGTVTQVRQEATTESNVVTYEVVISAPNDNLMLKPGLTANVTIITMAKDNVLCIPTKALKFMPNEMMLPKGYTIVDCQHGNPNPAEHKVWILEGDKVKAVLVTTGFTAGSNVEITSGLKPGEKVVVGVEANSAAFAQEDDDSGSNPFMPGPPGKKNNKK